MWHRHTTRTSNSKLHRLQNLGLPLCVSAGVGLRQRDMPASPGDSSNTVGSPSSNTKSMEEVWNDLKLASLYDSSDVNALSSNSTNTATHSAFRSLVLHEFLSGPLVRDSPSSLSHNPTSPPHHPPFLPSLPQHQHEPTLLSLTSASESHNHTHHSSSFDALDSPTVCPSAGNKRTREHISHSNDRRHKRMIKNRESAARSRARKQAYTNELEHELATLREENARLRQQQEKFSLRPLDQHPKRRTLLRTLTAPF